MLGVRLINLSEKVTAHMRKGLPAELVARFLSSGATRGGLMFVFETHMKHRQPTCSRVTSSTAPPLSNPAIPRRDG